MGYGGESEQDQDVSRAGRINLFEEYQVRELQLIWEHSFQKVPPSAGDGITSKFFDYSGVTRTNADVHVEEGGYIRTKEAGDYGAGQPVTAGAAGHFDSAPTGDQDGWIGYTDSDDGYGFGYDATGLYVFDDFNGSRQTVRQSDWNIHKLNGDPGEGPDFDPVDGFTLRLPHACYGHSKAVVVIGVKLDNGGFKLYPVHQFNSIGETMWNDFDHPIEWNFSGTVGDGNFLAATACHYEGETGRNIKRTNGETFTAIRNGGTSISLPTFSGVTGGWVPLLAFKVRTDWENTTVTPLSFAVSSNNEIEVQITVRANLSNTDFKLPEATSTEECAVLYDIVNTEDKTSATTIDDIGEREYIRTIDGAGRAVNVSEDLENAVLAADDIVLLSARPASGSSTSVTSATLRNGGGF